MAVYTIQNQWGGNSAPWHDGGVFNIGNRDQQLPIALKITSGDGGKTFTGTMTYVGEGPIGTRATLVTTNCYQVENQWGGTVLSSTLHFAFHDPMPGVDYVPIVRQLVRAGADVSVVDPFPTGHAGIDDALRGAAT